MSVQLLTIQAYLQGSWQDIAQLDFNNNKKLSDFSYLPDYGLAHFLADNHFATSINYPVELFTENIENGWLPFLDDIIPAGASKRYWLERLDLTRLPKSEQDYALLKNATIAPVGHLRIKEALPQFVDDTPKSFSLIEVVNRDVNFLE